MEWLRELIKSKPHVVLSMPAILCFVTFILNFFTAVSDGKIDANEMTTLLGTADGFETVVLFVVMLALRNKKP